MGSWLLRCVSLALRHFPSYWSGAHEGGRLHVGGMHTVFESVFKVGDTGLLVSCNLGESVKQSLILWIC
jgi:hypothetical protein